jgi:hypothetical protein
LSGGVEYLEAYHGIMDQCKKGADVFQEMITFLTTHSSEAIVIRLRWEERSNGKQGSPTKNLDVIFAEIMTAKGSQYFYTENTIPTLDTIRGKILLLRDWSPGTTTIGIDYTAISTATNIQDTYSLSGADANARAISLVNKFTEFKTF